MQLTIFQCTFAEALKLIFYMYLSRHIEKDRVDISYRVIWLSIIVCRNGFGCLWYYYPFLSHISLTSNNYPSYSHFWYLSSLLLLPSLTSGTCPRCYYYCCICLNNILMFAKCLVIALMENSHENNMWSHVDTRDLMCNTCGLHNILNHMNNSHDFHMWTKVYHMNIGIKTCGSKHHVWNICETHQVHITWTVHTFFTLSEKNN